MIREERKYIGKEGYIVKFSKTELVSIDDSLHISLGPMEYKVLSYFIDHANTPVYLEDLAKGVWGVNYSADRKDPTSLKTHITHIRAKLDKIKAGLGKRIETNYGLSSYTLTIPNKLIEVNSKATDTIGIFLNTIEKYESDFLKSIMCCSCKWGACTFDDIPQNTNTCEGALALLVSSQKEEYGDVIDDATDYLIRECSNHGLISKSLNEETVVPTAMLLLLCNKLNRYEDLILPVAKHLWDARSNNGWGIYVRNMGKFSNIGCTYWALIGLMGLSCVTQSEFQKYLRSLYKYEGSYAFGRTVDDINPRIPNMYATSMMYILYNMLSEDSKEKIGTRYNYRKALNYILDNFDNPFFLAEQEGITGVEVNGQTSVHTVNWNHISINYSLTAIALAIEKEVLKKDEMCLVLNRILKVVEDNNERNQGLIFWTAPHLSVDCGSRGEQIFPTMHLLIGLSKVREALMKLK